MEETFIKVSITLSEAAVTTTRRDKASELEHTRFGAVQFESKGVVAA